MDVNALGRAYVDPIVSFAGCSFSIRSLLNSEEQPGNQLFAGSWFQGMIHLS